MSATSKNVNVDNSFFNKEVLEKLNNPSLTLEEMKTISLEAIANLPNAKQSNIEKAKNMVNKSRSKVNLLSGCYNFVLSIEGHRVI